MDTSRSWWWRTGFQQMHYFLVSLLILHDGHTWLTSLFNLHFTLLRWFITRVPRITLVQWVRTCAVGEHGECYKWLWQARPMASKFPGSSSLWMGPVHFRFSRLSHANNTSRLKKQEFLFWTSPDMSGNLKYKHNRENLAALRGERQDNAKSEMSKICVWVFS